jgi:glycosyltransferase involved in cell wall biosynthesis
MDSPRIYIAVASFYPSVGGIQQQALIQSRMLHKRGYQVSIVTFRHRKEWLPYEIIDGVPVMRIAGTFLVTRDKYPRIVRKICYFIAMLVMGWTLWRHRQRYDLLHVHQLNLLALPTACVCRLTGIPMIVVVHRADSNRNMKPSQRSLVAGPLDPTLPWLQVDEQHPDRGDLEGLASKGKPIFLLTRFVVRYTDVRAVVIASCIEYNLSEYHFSLQQVQRIPNGVDIIRFAPGTSTCNDHNYPVVICIGRLCYQKGIDVLLQSWSLLHEKQYIQKIRAKLLIVGDGPMRQQFEAMAEALGIADSVEFRGEQRDVAAYFHQGTIAVLPSRSEGMPNVLLEAMACALPCIATRVSGCEELIQHGVNGLLVEPEDYEELAQTLLTLLTHPTLARSYGAAARATVEQYYSLEHIVDMYIELYRECTRERNRNACVF